MSIQVDDSCLFTRQFADLIMVMSKLVEKYREWDLTVNINKPNIYVEKKQFTLYAHVERMPDSSC